MPGHVYDQSTKYWLTGGRKQINLSQYDKWWSSWALGLDFGERFYKEKKEGKFSKNSSEISYENIIIKYKTGGIERKRKELKYFLISILGLNPSILALEKD